MTVAWHLRSGPGQATGSVKRWLTRQSSTAAVVPADAAWGMGSSNIKGSGGNGVVAQHRENVVHQHGQRPARYTLRQTAARASGGGADGPPSSASQDRAERISKRLSRLGLCSRRVAERWIADGRVRVDGEVLASAATLVRRGNIIAVDGKPVPPASPPQIILYHKPRKVRVRFVHPHSATYGDCVDCYLLQQQC
jgi:hypothetical protein